MTGPGFRVLGDLGESALTAPTIHDCQVVYSNSSVRAVAVLGALQIIFLIYKLLLII